VKSARRVLVTVPGGLLLHADRAILREVRMSDKRITVYVLQPKDRDTLQPQWVDPDTGNRKTQSAKTADPKEAEAARVDLEYRLNNGGYAEPSKLEWDHFRQLFAEEYLAGLRARTREKYQAVLDV
jgi:hypothetical protein